MPVPCLKLNKTNKKELILISSFFVGFLIKNGADFEHFDNQSVLLIHC